MPPVRGEDAEEGPVVADPMVLSDEVTDAGEILVEQQQFEGRLTQPQQASEDDENEELNGTEEDGKGLRVEAPEFVPGVQPAEKPPQAPKAKAKVKAKPPKVTTKSTAPDIATRTHEDIAHNLYECPICTSELGRRSRVWSCQLCWTVFHLSCIKKWSQNEGSAAAQDAARRLEDGNEEATAASRAWRCPGCNLAQEVRPTTYSCWCEKEVDPRPLPGLPPHSCGQTCSRPRKGCPHPCDATCHAGPCAPCTAMGPTQDCFCGRTSSTKRCQDTDYENGWSCGEICGDLLPCGEHTCPRPCHEGLCGACEVKIEARCYCGKVETEMLCSSKDEELESTRVDETTGQSDDWIGCFNCGDVCDRPFACGKHTCQKACHPQDAHPALCPKSPDVVLHCPCGKTLLAGIPDYTPRTSCEDPIPNCREACGKILPCGHSCDQVCHTGTCGPCLRVVLIGCRCGRTTSRTLCHQGTIEPPQCFRQCKSALHCGRHACAERCCPGEQKAIERQALRRRLKPHLRPSDDEIEAEHICTRVCGRGLKCGRHTCPELCHKGACNTCREAIFEEIACHCGRTILYPPLPCGTQPPPCSYPCHRSKACGHPQTAHNCHTDDESCPKCPFLTEKACLCGKRTLKNQPCWLTDARCGQICGRPLKCGSHVCQKDCHRPGECEDACTPCTQACGKTKALCGHPCTEPCHAPYPCTEKNPCTAPVIITCGCGRLRQEKRCAAARAVTTKGSSLPQPATQPTQVPRGVQTLACDEECARLERNRSLASALGIEIDPSTTTAAGSSTTGHSLPYSTETLDLYMHLSSTSPLATLQSYESSLHTLAVSATQRSVRFQPAKSSLRAFVHSLAADWGFASESFDPEPHRHVFVLKPGAWTPPALFNTGNPTSVAIGIGGMSVGECMRTRERQRAKERDAQRVAAAEAQAAKEAARAAGIGSFGGGGGGGGHGVNDGWAQVASRRKLGASGGRSPATVSTTPLFAGGSMYAALAGEQGVSGKKDRLVLRSGVGASKQLRAEVVDSWEDEVGDEENEENEENEGNEGNEENEGNEGNEENEEESKEKSEESEENEEKGNKGHSEQ
ncbi:hypothetical protein ASPZODRAFT_1236892 [Penicilliopsis zonata CBS 506.65]|uniref:R3H domain-containing protein n=1 Tax=Penicilliopsis zonata CBS 506.65 TaxID=1073090 RepID=A0A1L9S6W3_9EURO|nr:hypothetical protein ASPZODRAFT_1236892 [Penicilliopsis zonata CBS 506.65]OJJ42906.1 hypothetical protein ASPZODRAFT_1236892 [Penicilliopsis zonata CBS 506.65]